MKAILCFLAAFSVVLATASAPGEENPALRQLQSSNPRVIAEAFECDDLLQPLPQALRPIGYEVRVCVEPNRPTRNRGIVMRSINSFTFYQNLGSAVQRAIVNGNELDQRTLLVCVAGELICSFKTKLDDDFFYMNTPNGTVTGTGEVSMEVEEEDGTRRVLTGGIGLRGLQADTAAGGFAGADDVSLDILVEGSPRPEGLVRGTPEEKSWWEDSPVWLRVLVIVGAALILIMICALIGICIWSARDMVNQTGRKRTDRSHETTDEDVDVHVQRAVHTSYQPQAAPVPQMTQAQRAQTPLPQDVCFDAVKHPGTAAMEKAVRKSVKEFPKTQYCPKVYRHMKRQLPGRRFFVCDDENKPNVWREVPKAELVELFRREFEAAQSSRRR